MSQKIYLVKQKWFKTFCKEKNLTIVTVDGDGHCLLYASLTSFHGNIYFYDEILNIIFDELTKETERWLQFTTLNKFQFLKSVNEYIKNKIWQTESVDVLIQCVSKILKCKIIVFKILSNNEFHMITSAYDDNYQKSILLKLQDGHYDSIVTGFF
jgi:hypothetical protein